jgi:hypothetical protein
MSNSEPSPEEIERRNQRFDGHLRPLEHRSVVKSHAHGVLCRCPCCGSRTLGKRGGSLICPVCFWEDDGQEDQDADTVRGGPNGALSLAQARQNYTSFGACDRASLKHVRKPTQEEL